jgi:4-phospho-D-threonate 3-dehydrogenase / 4-phospho-D-erythronate 3-dehydrogenase
MITVLADDLSGAAEVAGVFLHRAAPLSLRLNTFGPPAEPGVVIADLNTRSLTPHEAAQAVRSALTDVPAHLRVLKKIDSLLRGNIAAEVEVLAERGPVVVAAALPALGRVPSRHSVAELFPERLMATGRIRICDAATDGDLDDVVSAANRIPGAQLVGTSALAAAVARTLPAGHPPEAQPRASNSVLTVVGTAEPTATTQVEALVADGAREVAVDARALLHDKADPEPIQRALDRGSAVVTIGGVVEPSEGQFVSAALGQFIASAAAQRRPDLVLTGGETARAVIDAIGIRSLRPVHEIHHGAVASVAPDGRRVVTRPGSFGDADSLVTIARYLNPQNKDNA